MRLEGIERGASRYRANARLAGCRETRGDQAADGARADDADLHGDPLSCSRDHARFGLGARGLDNPAMESFFASLEKECIYRGNSAFDTRAMRVSKTLQFEINKAAEASRN